MPQEINLAAMEAPPDMAKPVTFRTRILRKQPGLPRYIVIRPEHLPGRATSFPAEIYLDDAGPFPRTIHPWGKGSDVFFVNLTEPQCRKAGLDTSDECQVTIVPLTQVS